MKSSNAEEISPIPERLQSEEVSKCLGFLKINGSGHVQEVRSTIEAPPTTQKVVAIMLYKSLSPRARTMNLGSRQSN